MVDQFGIGTTSPDWGGLAGLAGLRAVIDPNDRIGAKNGIIDRAQKRALSRAIGNVRGSYVLDYGCGIGRITEWLAKQGANVVGVDPSAAMLERARLRVPSAQFEHIGPDEMPPVEGTPFDVIVAVCVLQYLAPYPARLGQATRRLAGLLRAGGRLVLVEQVHDGGLNRGAAWQTYEAALRNAGLRYEYGRRLRLGHSLPLGYVTRYPLLRRAPGIPWLLAAEASRHREALVNGQYADTLFVAVK